jgi:hypothetical protein
MIPVPRQPEPSNFDRDVRQPGQSYLANNPNPTFKERRSKCWARALEDLHEAYNRICAYSCFYLIQQGTVDHFLPKKFYPQFAYEWDNYRLAAPRINNYKGENKGLIDPFIVKPGWFVLAFPSCFVKVGDGLSKHITDNIKKTIDILRLNSDDYMVQGRLEIMLEFAEGMISLSFLKRKYPFLASEIVRQGIETTAHTIFKRRTRRLHNAV